MSNRKFKLKFMKSKLLPFIAITILFCGFSAFFGQQEALKLSSVDKYKVIRVDGKIIFMPTKTPMKKGDVFLSGTALDFVSPQSRAAVISAIKGRFVLTPAEQGQTKILPAANNISSRSGALINKIDMTNHFNGKYLILDEIELELSNAAYPMNDNNFFYLSYMHNGEKINKKLAFNADHLIISKDELFKVDDQPIDVEEKQMVLYYKSSDKTDKINEFTPIFPDMEELKSEIQIILDEFSNKDKEVQINEITAYLDQFYGKPNKENLKNWMEKEFKF